MSEYIDEFESIFNQLGIMESHVSESMQIAVLFASYGSTSDTPYRAVITALQRMTDEELTWDRASARLLQEYSACNSDNQTFVAGGSIETGIQQTALKSKANIQCYGCGKYGHYKRECRSRIGSHVKGSHRSYSDRKMKIGDSFGQQRALITRTERTFTGSIVVDSGAGCHMMANKNLFNSLHETHPGTITVGDAYRLTATRMGSVLIPLNLQGNKKATGNNLTLNRVLYVPKLDTNLLSCYALDMDGYTTRFGDGKCVISLDGEVMSRAQLRDGLYILQTTKINDRAHVARTEQNVDANELWHRRYGHAYVRTLKEMPRKGTVHGMSWGMICHVYPV